MPRPLLASAFALAITLAGAFSDAAAPSPILKYALPNGLTVVLQEDHTSPRVAVDTCYHVGVADDPKARRGMARLVAASLADPSTRHVGRRVRADLFASIGVPALETRVETGWGRTSASLVVPSAELALALWLESDRMGFTADGIDRGHLDDVRAPIAERRKSRMARAYEGVIPLVSAALYGPTDPLGGTFDGDAGDLADITSAEVKARLLAYYGPANATLILAGDVTKAKAEELVATYFGTLVGPARPTRRDAATPVLSEERRLTIEAGVDRARLVVGWATARYLDPDDEALDLAADVLTERLRRRLVEQEKLAGDVRAWEASNLYGSLFTVTITLVAGGDAASLKAPLDEELAKLRDVGLTEDELHPARLRYVASNAVDSDTLLGRALHMGDYEHYVGDPGFLPVVMARYRDLSPAAIRAAVRANLVTDKRVVASVVPTSGAPAAGRLAGGS